MSISEYPKASTGLTVISIRVRCLMTEKFRFVIADHSPKMESQDLPYPSDTCATHTGDGGFHDFTVPYWYFIA